MRIVSTVISMDVEIENARVEGDALVLSGFAGINEIETRVRGDEAWRLLRLLMQWKVVWFMLRAARRS